MGKRPLSGPKLPDDPFVPVKTGLRIVVTEKTKAEIVKSIRAFDKKADSFLDRYLDSEDLTADELPLMAIRDYATSPVYKTNENGKREKVRDPLADSLEDYLKDIVRIGRVRWETVLDNATGDIDRSLNGTEWDVEDPQAPQPPIHKFCRCRLIPITPPVYK